jgi:hypothetical protein
MQKNSLTKFNILSGLKTLEKIEMVRTHLNIIKAFYEKPLANIILSGKKLKYRKETRVSTFSTLI